jgi:hypothetical protein
LSIFNTGLGSTIVDDTCRVISYNDLSKEQLTLEFFKELMRHNFPVAGREHAIEAVYGTIERHLPQGQRSVGPPIHRQLYGSCALASLLTAIEARFPDSPGVVAAIRADGTVAAAEELERVSHSVALTGKASASILTIELCAELCAAAPNENLLNTHIEQLREELRTLESRSHLSTQDKSRKERVQELLTLIDKIPFFRRGQKREYLRALANKIPGDMVAAGLDVYPVAEFPRELFEDLAAARNVPFVVSASQQAVAALKAQTRRELAELRQMVDLYDEIFLEAKDDNGVATLQQRLGERCKGLRFRTGIVSTKEKREEKKLKIIQEIPEACKRTEGSIQLAYLRKQREQLLSEIRFKERFIATWVNS